MLYNNNYSLENNFNFHSNYKNNRKIIFYFKYSNLITHK